MKGAEAVVSFSKLLGKKIVIKERIPKSYRTKELDSVLRKTRTRIEARLLNKAKKAHVPCPTVFYVGPFSLWLSFVKGKRPSLNVVHAQEAGTLLARLHGADIIHGDYTFANLLFDTTLYVIDFGLGFFSSDIEDKAIDVITMVYSLEDEKLKTAFLEGYKSYLSYDTIIERTKLVMSRVRYF